MTSTTAAGHSVVIGGGAVGGMFARFLAESGHHVDVIDAVADPAAAGRLSPGGGIRFVTGDITDLSPELADRIGRADTVVLAVPEPVALAALDGVAAAMADGALLVDTLSVKSRIVPAVREAAPHLEAVSLNPMFTPSLGAVGRPIAVVVVRDGPRVRDLLWRIGEWGSRAVPVTAAQHDRAASALQVLPHAAVLAFGLALASLDVTAAELEALAPPPYRTMLALLARISSGAPEVYWDVQRANPSGQRAREQLAGALRELAGLVDQDDHGGFGATLDRLRGFLGSELGRYRALCARVFVTMDRAGDCV